MLELSERDFKITAIIYITSKISSKNHKQHKNGEFIREMENYKKETNRNIRKKTGYQK